MLEWLRDDPLGFLQFMLYRTPAVLIALTLHELAHGYSAYQSGDHTAKNLGRLSLNPLKHLDLIGTISMFLLGVGWAKPVPVNPLNFRKPRWDDLKVSLAGVTTNFVLFLLATLFTVVVGFSLYKPETLNQIGMSALLDFRTLGFYVQTNPNDPQLLQYISNPQAFLNSILKNPWLLHVQRFLFQLALVNLGMCLFNLLPIPPLDGFHVVNNLLFKGKIDISGQVFRYVHFALIVLLLTTDFIGSFVSKALYAVQGFVLPLVMLPFGVS